MRLVGCIPLPPFFLTLAIKVPAHAVCLLGRFRRSSGTRPLLEGLPITAPLPSWWGSVRDSFIGKQPVPFLICFPNPVSCRPLCWATSCWCFQTRCVRNLSRCLRNPAQVLPRPCPSPRACSQLHRCSRSAREWGHHIWLSQVRVWARGRCEASPSGSFSFPPSGRERVDAEAGSTQGLVCVLGVFLGGASRTGLEGPSPSLESQGGGRWESCPIQPSWESWGHVSANLGQNTPSCRLKGQRLCKENVLGKGGWAHLGS